MEERNSLTQESIPNDDTDEPNKHFPHFNENGNHFSDVSHMQKLLESSSGSEENTSVLPNHLKVGYSESPRTTLSRFIPESPFKINGNLCDSKIFVRPSLPNSSRSFHVSLSMVDNDEDGTEVMFSKSCDCNEEIISSLHSTSMIRSVSEDILQTPAEELSRRISVVSSSKGKLMGVPRVRPGEKLVRSPSVSSQPPFKSPAGPGEEEGALPKKVKFTSEQKWIAFCLCLVDFTAFLSMSIIAPFFPREVCDFS